jgi:hypothetical protein
MNKLDKTVAVILAAIAGCAAMALALLIVAKGLGIGGGGIIYVVVLLGVGGACYKSCVKFVQRFSWIRWPVLAIVLIGIAYLSINYKHLGFEDPIVPIIIVIIPIACLYMFLPNTTKAQGNKLQNNMDSSSQVSSAAQQPSTAVAESELGTPETNKLVYVMETDKDWMKRLDAAEALARLNDTRGLDYLRKSLQDSNSEIREVSREILSGFSGNSEESQEKNKDNQPTNP